MRTLATMVLGMDRIFIRVYLWRLIVQNESARMISKRVAVCPEKNSIFMNFVRDAIGSSRDEPTRCSADVFAKRPAATACQRSNYANNWMPTIRNDFTT